MIFFYGAFFQSHDVPRVPSSEHLDTVNNCEFFSFLEMSSLQEMQRVDQSSF